MQKSLEVTRKLHKLSQCFCRCLTSAALVAVSFGCGCQSSTPAPSTAATPDPGNSAELAPAPILPVQEPSAVARAPKRLSLPELVADLPVPQKWQRLDQAQREYPSGELLALTEQALASVELKSNPIAVVFPVVDENNSIRVDGMALGLMANYSLTFLDEAPMAISPTELLAIWIDANCWRAGTVVDQQTLDLCRAACEANVTVLPVLTESLTSPGNVELRVTIRNATPDSSPNTARFQLSVEQLVEVPGMIARAVVDDLGLAISEPQADEVMTPELRSGRDLMVLAELLNPEAKTDDASFRTFLSENPACLAGWDAYLRRSERPDQALAGLDLLNPPIRSPELDIGIARCLGKLNRPEDGLLWLLKRSKTSARINDYYDVLTRCAFAIGHKPLEDSILNYWRKGKPGYVGMLARGRALSEFADEFERDHAHTAAGDVQEIQQRRLQARTELEQAVAVNTSDWQARTRLVSLAPALDMPRESLEQQFQAVISLRPRYRRIYEAKLDYLRRRRAESPQEFLAFAKTCTETNLWEDRIPQLVWQALREEVYDPATAAMKYSAFQSGVLWDALHFYFQALQAGTASDDEKRNMTKQFVVWAAFSGHYREALPVFWNEKVDFENGKRVDEVFGTEADHKYLVDLLDAHAGFGLHQKIARASMSVASGNWKLAEVDVTRTRAEPNGLKYSGERYERVRNQINLLRRLDEKRSVAMSPKELEANSGKVKYGNFFPVPSMANEQRLKLWPNSWSDFGMDVVLPVGLSRATISGTIEWSPDLQSFELIAHAYASRDRIRLEYLPGRSEVRMIRNGITLATAPLEHSPQSFRLEYGGERDSLGPCDGVTWEAVVADDVPSGFGVRVVSSPGSDAFVALSNVRIDLPKNDASALETTNNKEAMP